MIRALLYIAASVTVATIVYLLLLTVFLLAK